MAENVYDVYNFVARYKDKKEEFKTREFLDVCGKPVKLNINNRDLAVRYLEDKEKELVNANGYENKAQIRYTKTLYKLITTYLANVLYWFNDKNFQDITEEDIRVIYEKLEKGELETIKGKTKLKPETLRDYYSRVFRSGFFTFIEKDTLARKVIKRKFCESEEVRFFTKDVLKQIVDNCSMTSHKMMFLLLFDTGIEVSATCQLLKSDFVKDGDKYQVNVRKDISKKSRKMRYLPIMLTETNQMLDVYLTHLQDNERLFNFNPPNIYRVLKGIVEDKGLTVIPSKKPIIIRDFRSSCVCYLHSLGWQSDDLKSRLGHSPSSHEIDKYLNYLARPQKNKREEIKKVDYDMLQETINKQNDMIRTMQMQMQEANSKIEQLQDLKKGYKKWWDVGNMALKYHEKEQGNDDRVKFFEKREKMTSEEVDNFILEGEKFLKDVRNNKISVKQAKKRLENLKEKISVVK